VFEGRALDAEMIFTVFFPRNYAFLSILRSKFLLKNTFKMTAKSVLLRPQGLRHRARGPTCPFATPLPSAHFAVNKNSVFKQNSK